MITEQNKFKRAWIWIWYNTYTRVFLGLGGHVLFIAPVLYYVGITGESLRFWSSMSYILVIAWAVVDNDFSNLNRIGLDVDRRPLKY